MTTPMTTPMIGQRELAQLAKQSVFNHPLGGLAHALARFQATDPDVIGAQDYDGVEVARILAHLLADGWALTRKG